MQPIRRSRIAILVAAALGLASASASAQDAARSDISVIRGEAVRISDLEDWVIGIFAADANLTNWTFNFDTACVHSTSGAYRLEISVQNGPGALRLKNDAGDEMAYELYTSSFGLRANDARGNVNNTFYTSSPVRVTGRWGSPAQDCGGVPNIGFAAIVRQAAFNAAPAGIYRDYATIFVTPE